MIRHPGKFSFRVAKENLSGTQLRYRQACPSAIRNWVPDKLSFVCLRYATANEEKVFRDDAKGCYAVA